MTSIFMAMGIIDFILNLAGLLLWLNWRSNRFDPLVKRMPATLMGTLRPADPKKFRRWHLLVFIAVLLVLRALIYRWIGASFPKVWVGELNLGLTTLPFRSDLLVRMLTFSFFSFGQMMCIFYIWLLLLSLLAGPLPVQGLVTIPLGRVDDWPRWAKTILPFFVVAILWWLASGWLGHLGILPPISAAGHFQQALVLGISSYLLWKFPLGVILVLHLLNSYIYFGKHPLWKYIGATAETILRPLKKIPLRLGQVDFAPLVSLVLIFFAAHLAASGIRMPRGHDRKVESRMLDSQLAGPSNKEPLGIPGLVEIYGRLPF